MEDLVTNLLTGPPSCGMTTAVCRLIESAGGGSSSKKASANRLTSGS